MLQNSICGDQTQQAIWSSKLSTVSGAVDAFWAFFDALHRREFRKTMRFHEYSERELAPLVRSFLLGWFGHVRPEVRANLAGSLTGQGSIDFVIGNLGIELAVRRPLASRAALSDLTNATEIKKLMQFEGRSLLVLYDFSADPYNDDDLNRYREWRSLKEDESIEGHAFNLAYYYRDREGRSRITRCKTMNIRY